MEKESYCTLKNKQPDLNECFFAFSNEQFEKEKRKANIPKDKKVYSLSNGLYGTKEGLDNFVKQSNAISQKITDTCKPIEVYKYEFDNHECDYTGNDSAAIQIVIDYFGLEIAKEIKRKYGFYII